MRNTTIFAILALFSTLSLIAAQQSMPFAFHSKNKALNYEEDLFATKDEILDKFAASISTKSLENGVKAIVINIRTPSSLKGTIQKIQEYTKYLPQFTNYFRSQVVYDSINFIQDLQQTLNKFNIQVEINSEVKPQQVAIEETNVDLDDLTQLEQTVKKSLEKANQEDAAIFILFTEDPIYNTQKPRLLQVTANENTGPSMVQIPSGTLFGLILLFILFLPVLYIGISCLYGIESPEKFATQNLVVGREY